LDISFSALGNLSSLPREFKMADPFSLATGVAGLVSLALQVTSISYWYVRSVDDASESWKDIIEESKTPRNLLTDFQVNLLDDDGLADAFSSRASSVMTRLGALSSSIIPSVPERIIYSSSVAMGSGIIVLPSESIFEKCSEEIESFIRKVERKSEGNALKRGWYKLTNPFTAEDLQAILHMLHRCQTIFNTLIATDTLTLTADTHNMTKETRKDILYLRTKEEQENAMLC
jgi:hypothetical protein